MEEYSPDTKDIPFPSTSICDQSPRYNPEPDDENDLCAFCLDRIQNPEQLHCSHSFCRCCLAKYKEARSWVADRCPICRRRLDWQGSRQSQDDWRLFGFVLLGLMPLSLGPFYLLLLYW